METFHAERTLTELDHVRLLNLLRRDSRDEGSTLPWNALADLLDASDLVPSTEVSADIITMHSQVELRDVQTGQRTTLTLCYPMGADAAAGLVSVLTPVGSALLGMRVGSVARWNSPGGDERAAEIVAVLFQPESSGHYAM